VIYDLDGTLVDSRADLCDAVNATLLALGYEPLAGPVVLSFVGEGAELLVRRSLAAAGGDEARLPEAMTAWSAAYGARLLAKTRAYPGVVDLLREPPNLRAVLTNKPGGFARAICAGLGLTPFFRAVVGGDDAPKKPDPKGLLSLCGTLGVLPSEALLVGDSLFDVRCARNAGVPMCAVTWGLGSARELRDAAPAYVCSSAGEVGALLLRLRGA
jgi:phosphoglycolate phosphatase